jgi:two-component system copper resistance phosphate regulon response regulator CusR
VRVLVVEDDPDVRRSVARFLRHAGYVVDESGDLADADVKVAVNEYDVVVLDRTVPGGDTLSLVSRMRRAGSTVPVIFLTARAEVPERVEGLGGGADDYLVKPFSMDELVARVHALARRPGVGAPPTMAVGDLEVDPARGTARRRGERLDLTAKELILLRYLVGHAGTVISRSELVEHCWDEFADPMSNVVDVRIGALRRKLGEPPVIRTVRGFGYIIDGDAHDG